MITSVTCKKMAEHILVPSLHSCTNCKFPSLDIELWRTNLDDFLRPVLPVILITEAQPTQSVGRYLSCSRSQFLSLLGDRLRDSNWWWFIPTPNIFPIHFLRFANATSAIEHQHERGEEGVIFLNKTLVQDCSNFFHLEDFILSCPVQRNWF